MLAFIDLCEEARVSAGDDCGEVVWRVGAADGEIVDINHSDGDYDDYLTNRVRVSGMKPPAATR